MAVRGVAAGLRGLCERLQLQREGGSALGQPHFHRRDRAHAGPITFWGCFGDGRHQLLRR